MEVKDVFKDSAGKLSSKRIIGAIIVAAAVVFNGLSLGDPETNRVMIWAGIASLGVGTLETRVNK